MGRSKSRLAGEGRALIEDLRDQLERVVGGDVEVRSGPAVSPSARKSRFAPPVATLVVRGNPTEMADFDSYARARFTDNKYVSVSPNDPDQRRLCQHRTHEEGNKEQHIITLHHMRGSIAIEYRI